MSKFNHFQENDCDIVLFEAENEEKEEKKQQLQNKRNSKKEYYNDYITENNFLIF